MSGVKLIMDAADMDRMLSRLAHQIIEQNPDSDIIYLVGIKRRGVPLAGILAEKIQKFSNLEVVCGELDITLYRDDLTKKYDEPKLHETKIPFDVNGKRIILVDDVLFTGRTTRAAMDALIALGRPAKIESLVMVDRGHRELPISSNYVGKNIPTSREEFVSVRVMEYDGVNEVTISERRK